MGEDFTTTPMADASQSATGHRAPDAPAQTRIQTPRPTLPWRRLLRLRRPRTPARAKCAKSGSLGARIVRRQVNPGRAPREGDDGEETGITTSDARPLDKRLKGPGGGA